MARRGENIYKRKDGRWEGRYIKARSDSGKAVYGYVYSRTYRGVREKLHDMKKNAPSEAKKAPGTLSLYSEEWLRLSRNRVKEATYVKYYNIVKRHINPALGSLAPQTLTAMRIEEFSSCLLQSGLSPKTVRDILSVLRSILKYCIHTERLQIPLPDIVYPQDCREEMRVLSVNEQNLFVSHLLQNMDSTRFGVLLGLLTGMRIGEICALRWENISLESRTIQITSTMQRLQKLEPSDDAKTKVIIGSTKSRTSSRIIPMSKTVYDLCCLNRPENGKGYVLTGDSEKYMEPRALQYRMKKYTEECGLENVHFHTLRHTFATRCVEVGFEIKSLSEILGHSSTKVTLDRYVHSSLELKRTNMEKLEAVGL